MICFQPLPFAERQRQLALERGSTLECTRSSITLLMASQDPRFLPEDIFARHRLALLHPAPLASARPWLLLSRHRGRS